jgi:hypothetical protein
VPNFVGSIPLAFIVIAGVCAPLAGWLAMQRARNPIVWFAYGALIGPLAPLLLLAAPMGRCPQCETPAAGWSGRCAECGTALGGWFDDAPTGTATTDGTAALDTPGRAAPGPASGFAQPTRIQPTAAPIARASAPQAQATAPSHPTARPAGVAATAMSSGGAASLRARAPGSAPILDPGSGLTPSETASTGEVLATAVYLSGNAGLEIGACYAIARVDDRIRVFGPVDTGQLTIRHERPLDEGEVVAVDDRLVITLRRGRSSTSMIMRWVGGMAPAGVEAALAPASRDGRSIDGMRR